MFVTERRIINVDRRPATNRVRKCIGQHSVRSIVSHNLMQLTNQDASLVYGQDRGRYLVRRLIVAHPLPTLVGCIQILDDLGHKLHAAIHQARIDLDK